jgi:hypothetical protein
MVRPLPVVLLAGCFGGDPEPFSGLTWCSEPPESQFCSSSFVLGFAVIREGGYTIEHTEFDGEISCDEAQEISDQLISIRDLSPGTYTFGDPLDPAIHDATFSLRGNSGVGGTLVLTRVDGHGGRIEGTFEDVQLGQRVMHGRIDVPVCD